MADDLTRRAGQDRGRINLGQQHEVRDWAARFGVTREQLEAAVQSVGDRVDEVERHLRSIALWKRAIARGRTRARAKRPRSRGVRRRVNVHTVPRHAGVSCKHDTAR